LIDEKAENRYIKEHQKELTLSQITTKEFLSRKVEEPQKSLIQMRILVIN
jgi:hypothetical protein